MTESRIEKLRKQQHWVQECTKTPLTLEEEEERPKSDMLWRKPLPPNCPKFEFTDSGSTKGEKTLIQLDSQVNSIIPLRSDSRFYKQIPYFDALLERTCKSKRVMILSEILKNK